jgi:heptosyltransferase III
VSEGNILVIRGGAIGDFILTLPVLAALRENLPQARVEILAYPRVAPLAVAAGLAAASRSIDARPLAGFFAARGPLDEELQAYFASFAVIISYLYDPDGIFQANIGRCSRAQFIAAPHRPDERASMHATDVFLKPLERLAIFDSDPLPRLLLPSSLSPLPSLALHPGSGSESKNWFESNWSQLLRALVQETTVPLLLIGGEAEGERLQRLTRDLPSVRFALAENLPLVELAQRLAGCRAFVGHDSGITHLAAAVGLPGLVLWGPSNDVVWRPRSERMKILRGSPGLASLPVEKVLAGVREM